ncbi:hypothetical protein Anapl_01189 [Anas platyrhynchos]|uniref:Uncharacterized protein n=1 Tax=Anas platyrhynchos TaxID=8839 RepID=R0K6U9_ANAPL|nr:hypothetical protein Anapl_01189 [Anas platyrhynchos]
MDELWPVALWWLEVLLVLVLPAAPQHLLGLSCWCPGRLQHEQVQKAKTQLLAGMAALPASRAPSAQHTSDFSSQECDAPVENAAAGQQLNMGSTPIFDQNRGYWPLDPSSFNESESALNFSETMAETPLCHSVLSRKANSGLLQAEDANILVETPQGSKEKLASRKSRYASTEQAIRDPQRGSSRSSGLQGGGEAQAVHTQPVSLQNARKHPVFASGRQDEAGAGGGLSGGHTRPYHPLREAKATSLEGKHEGRRQTDSPHFDLPHYLDSFRKVAAHELRAKYSCWGNHLQLHLQDTWFRRCVKIKVSTSATPGKTGRAPPQLPTTSTEPELSAAAQSRACALGAMKGATQSQTHGRRRRLMSSSACKGTVPAARLAVPKSKEVESEQCPISLRDRYSEPGKRLARQKTAKVQLCLLLGTARSQHWEHL